MGRCSSGSKIMSASLPWSVAQPLPDDFTVAFISCHPFHLLSEKLSPLLPCPTPAPSGAGAPPPRHGTRPAPVTWLQFARARGPHAYRKWLRQLALESAVRAGS